MWINIYRVVVSYQQNHHENHHIVPSSRRQPSLGVHHRWRARAGTWQWTVARGRGAATGCQGGFSGMISPWKIGNEPPNHRGKMGKMMICWMWIWWWQTIFWAQAFKKSIHYPLLDMDGIMNTIILLVWGKLMIIAVFFLSVFFSFSVRTDPNSQLPVWHDLLFEERVLTLW